MIILSILVVSPALAALLALFSLGFMSKSGAANGLIDGRLTPCPDRPNCVCSEYAADAEHRIEPIDIPNGDTALFMNRLRQSVQAMGGRIETDRPDYLAATFTSSIFGFVDDLEIRIDAAQTRAHLRSASRVGYSDRGVNRERVEQLRNQSR